jgi:hypothetical protein
MSETAASTHLLSETLHGDNVLQFSINNNNNNTQSATHNREFLAGIVHFAYGNVV